MKHTIPGIVRTATAILLFFAVFAGGAAAQNAPTRDTFEFKNRIVDEEGQAIPDGTYNMKFILFNEDTGGAELWSEARAVPTRRGNFSVNLGSVNPFPKNALGDTSNLYLHICLDFNGADGDGSGICANRYEENFRTRKRITSVPWALRSFALGPVSINEGGVAYPINVTGSAGTIASFRYLGSNRFNISTGGTANLTNGTNTFTFNPGAQTINLTSGSDIFFGSSSLKSTGAGTSGGSLIGVNQANFTNITGANVQEVLDSIDDAVGGGGGGGAETDPIWTAAQAGTTSVTGAWTFTATPTASTGLVVGNNTGTTAGTIRFTGTDFEGYDGSSWNSLTGGGGGPETDPEWIADRDLDDTLVQADWEFEAPLFVDDLIPSTDDENVVGDIFRRFSEGRFSDYLLVGTLDNYVPGQADLHIDGRGDSTQTAGNYYPIHITTEYEPTSGTGAENFNNLYIQSEVLAGDGSTINRQRAIRTELTNNSTGTVNGIFSNSNSATSNGPISGSFYSYSGSVTNNDSVGGFLEGAYVGVINNGTVPNIRSWESGSTNSGTVSSMIGDHIIMTNNDTVGGGMFGEAMTMTNSASSDVNNLIGEGYTIRNDGNVNGRNTVGFYDLDNNGTFTDIDHGFYNFDFYNGATGSIPQWYGLASLSANDGTASGGYHNFRVDTFNGATGTVGAGMSGMHNVMRNEGSVTGTYDGVTNTLGFGNINGDVYAMHNNLGSITLTQNYSHSADNVYGVSVYADGGNDPSQQIDSTGDIIGFRNRLLRNINAGDDIIGFYNEVTASGTATEYVGIYNEVNPTGAGDPSEYYGMYSTNGITDTYLNYQGAPGTNYSIYGDTAYFDTIDVGDESNRLSNSVGSAASNDLYYGNDLLCDVSEPNCGIGGGGGGGSLWTDNGFGDIYYNAGEVAIGDTDPFGIALYIDGSSAPSGQGLSVGGSSVAFDGPVGIGSAFYSGTGNQELYISRQSSTAHITMEDSGWGDPGSPDEGSLWWNGSELNFYDGSSTTDLLSGGGGGGGGFFTESCCGDIFYDGGYVSIGTSDTYADLTIFGDVYQDGGSVFFMDGDVQFDPSSIGFGINDNTYTEFYGDVSHYGSYWEWDSGDVYFDSGNEIVLGNNGTPTYIYGDTESYGASYFYNGINLSTGDMYVENGYLCVDDGSFSCPAGSAGEIYGRYAYGQFDVAENIHTRNDVVPGDIVMIDPEHNEAVMLTNSAYQADVLGVISTDPGVKGGAKLEPFGDYLVQPISLAGRVPVKVSNQNGSIQIGDAITTSDEPGVGMKATKTGRIIGFAMEALDGPEGQIVVFLDAGYYQPDGETTGTNGVSGKTVIKAGAVSVTVMDKDVHTGSIITVTPTSSTRGQVPYIVTQREGSFTVRIDSSVNSDITLNYIAM